MTIPIERMRALKWGLELLGRMSQGTDVPEGLAIAAERIAVAFPNQHEIEARLEAGAVGMPRAWTDSLLDARRLFISLRCTSGAENIDRDLKFVLRHFPDEMTIAGMSQTLPLRAWLHPLG